MLLNDLIRMLEAQRRGTGEGQEVYVSDEEGTGTITMVTSSSPGFVRIIATRDED